MEKHRINWIDYAKGIGIILVVYGHMIRGMSQQISAEFFYISDSVVYGFHMPLFFFLAGLFVEKWAASPSKIALKQKVLTLIYPYFLWSIVQGLINFFLSCYTNTPMSLKTLLNIAFMPIAQFWFLYVLFFIYFLYYFLRKFLDIRAIFLISLLMFLVSPFVKFWVLGLVFINFIFFTGGAFVFSKFNIKNFEKVCTPKILSAVFVVFAFSNYVFVANCKNTQIFIKNMLSLPIAVIGTIFCLILAAVLANHNIFPKLKYIGSVSMIIYLTHIIFSAGIRIVMLKLFHIHNIYFIMLICVLFGVLLPIAFFKISTKLGLNKVLFGKEIKA